MKRVLDLFDRLKDPELSFEEKYPHFDTQDGKMHILYLSVCLNASGFYRAIAPMFSLNESETHAVIIADMRKFDFNASPYEYEFPDADGETLYLLMMWADYVVIPMTTSDLLLSTTVLRKLNEEARLVMDIDRNLHLLPNDHPFYRNMGDWKKRLLKSNMLSVDMLTASSPDLLWYYDELLGKSDVKMECLPSLLSSMPYDELEPLAPSENTRIRIGIVANISAVLDVLTIWRVLRDIQDQYGPKVEFILFGWNGHLYDGTLVLKGLEYTYVKSVSFLDYHNKLNELQLDIALLPMRGLDYHKVGKPFTKFLELAACQLPVVVSDIAPYNKIIENGVNGFLASEPDHWIAILKRLIEDHSLRKSVGFQAHSEVWETHGFSEKTLQLYQEVFSG